MQWSVAHENIHVRQSGNWHPGGSWQQAYGAWNPGANGTNDYDADILANAHEDSICTDWRNASTWQTFYHQTGASDQEVEAEREAQSHTLANHALDFSRPGFNSVPTR
jgi:hypothetical protein